VVKLTDKSGELQVTVRGTVAKPEHILAPREGKWALLSKSDK
jgi:hypothetical protein